VRSWIVALAFVSSAFGGAPALGQEREIGPDVRVHPALGSKYLSKPRDVLVWLPPGYLSDRERRYPVVVG
jgi:hypothetical protein